MPTCLRHAWGRHVTVGLSDGRALQLDVGLQPCGRLQQLAMHVLRAVLADAEYAGLLRALYAHPGARGSNA